MSKLSYEFSFYVSVGAGLANATSSFMIMAGLFGLVHGLWTVLAVFGSAMICCVIASSVGEQASLFPGSAGLRTYLTAAFGSSPSLFLVYEYLAFMVLGAGIEMRLFSLVFTAVFPHFPALTVLILLSAAIVLINLLGIEMPRIVQIITITLVLSGIALLGISGIFASNHSMALLRSTFQHENLKSIMLLPAAIGMGFFLFVGYEWVTPLGFRPQSYQRLIPYSMLAAILVTGVAAALFVAGLGAQFPQTAALTAPLPQLHLTTQLFGNRGKVLALILCALATFSTFNAGLLGGARLLYALAREGSFFRLGAKISFKNGITYGSILLLGLISLASSLVLMRFELEMTAATIASGIICFIYSALLLSLVRLRKVAAGRTGQHRSSIPLWVFWMVIPILPLLGVASLVMTPEVGWGAAVGFLCCVVISGVLTWWFRGKRPVGSGRRSSAVKETAIGS